MDPALEERQEACRGREGTIPEVEGKACCQRRGQALDQVHHGPKSPVEEGRRRSCSGDKAQEERGLEGHVAEQVDALVAREPFRRISQQIFGQNDP